MSAGSYIGRSPQFGFFEKQLLTGVNGILDTFPLNFQTADSAQLLVSVGGVIQQPGTAYTVDMGAKHSNHIPGLKRSGHRVHNYFHMRFVAQT